MHFFTTLLILPTALMADPIIPALQMTQRHMKDTASVLGDIKMLMVAMDDLQESVADIQLRLQTQGHRNALSDESQQFQSILVAMEDLHEIVADIQLTLQTQGPHNAVDDQKQQFLSTADQVVQDVERTLEDNLKDCQPGQSSDAVETPNDRFKDCQDVFDSGKRESNIYKIYLQSTGKLLDVFCDMETTDGGWLVFQRRMDNSQDFDQNWDAYSAGFGSSRGEFWLGNEYLHQLTSQESQVLHIDLTTSTGRRYYAEYQDFMIGSAEESYKLQVGNYSGTAGDGFNFILDSNYGYVHNGMKFTTKDIDNDQKASGNCAQVFQMGWWFNDCFCAALNGALEDSVGGVWCNLGWYWLVELANVEMKMKPKDH